MKRSTKLILGVGIVLVIAAAVLIPLWQLGYFSPKKSAPGKPTPLGPGGQHAYTPLGPGGQHTHSPLGPGGARIINPTPLGPGGAPTGIVCTGGSNSVSIEPSPTAIDNFNLQYGVVLLYNGGEKCTNVPLTVNLTVNGATYTNYVTFTDVADVQMVHVELYHPLIQGKLYTGYFTIINSLTNSEIFSEDIDIYYDPS